MLEIVGQYGLQYSDQAKGTLRRLVAMPSLVSKVIESQGQDSEIVCNTLKYTLVIFKHNYDIL